jgi:flagellar protein FliO/FliZ
VDLSYVRFLLAFLFVIGLIGLFALLLRRVGFGGVRLSPGFKGKARPKRRLAVTEVANVDGRHRLVLVRRDDTEHLILLGHSGDLLIESNIKISGAAEGTPGSFDAALQSAGEKRT